MAGPQPAVWIAWNSSSVVDGWTGAILSPYRSRCGVVRCDICRGGTGPGCANSARSLAPFHPVLRHSKNIPLHVWPRLPFIACLYLAFHPSFHPQLHFSPPAAYSLPTTVDVISRGRNHNSSSHKHETLLFCFHCYHIFTSAALSYVRPLHPICWTLAPPFLFHQ